MAHASSSSLTWATCPNLRGNLAAIAACRIQRPSKLLPSFSSSPPPPPPPPATLKPALAFAPKQLPPPFLLSSRDGDVRKSSDQVAVLPPRSTRLMSVMVAPLSLVAVATLPGAEGVAAAFEPFVELVRSWNLPEWLVHWGHPGNMGVVLFAMGGYGSYLGWQIKLADDVEVKAMAKDLHPKLLAGMFFFFALGATGGIVSLLTEGKPIFESSHAVTGLSGLALLTVQSLLTTLFEGNPGLRSVHGVLGSGIMLLFLVHAAFGLQLGLSS